jgi:hypothetical protein
MRDKKGEAKRKPTHHKNKKKICAQCKKWLIKIEY